MVLISKITPPKQQNIVERNRLYKLLDSMTEKPIIWVSAPAGSGKTTLVANWLYSRKIPFLWYQVDERDNDIATFFYYMGLAVKNSIPQKRKPMPLLTPEYLTGIPTFTRRYFEELYNRFLQFKENTQDLINSNPSQELKSRPRGVIVFDNYQEVTNPQFNEMIISSLEVIPKDFSIIIISRNQPSSEFARYFANESISLIRDSDIRFNFEETRRLVKLRMHNNDSSFVQSIFEKTGGWVAGIVLMMELKRLKGETGEEVFSEAVFDYFASEIFNKTEQNVKEFMMKTAFLPLINISSAEKLTGLMDSDKILEKLEHQHYFTYKLSGVKEYLYHPLFKEFLLKMAKNTLTIDEKADIEKDTAKLLEQTGHIEDATKLYKTAGDIDSLCRIIINNAYDFLLQGRSNTLKDMISTIPDDKVNQNNWLLYWKGMSFFPIDIAEARKHLEKAFNLFIAVGDSKGIYLSWAGLVDTYAFGLDEWTPLDFLIDEFEKITKEHKFPSAEIELIASSRMLMALTLRRTDKPERVNRWLNYVSAFLHNNPSFEIKMDTIFSMSLYYLWKGEYDKSELLLEKAEYEVLSNKPPAFILIKIKLMKGVHYWIRADYKKALEKLTEGLDLSAESGVHIFDSLLWSFKTASEIANGNIDSAKEALQNQIISLSNKDRTLDSFFYHINCAWYHLTNGNPALAKEYMQTISSKTARMGAPYYKALWHIGMAQTEFALRNNIEAKSHVNVALKIGGQMKSYVIEWYSLLVSAYFHFEEGDDKTAIDFLQKGFALGRKKGYVHLEFYQPEMMRLLFSQAIKNSIEIEYVKELIKKLRLYPINIRTLGTFEVIKDGKPLTFMGRVKQKPLDLLKAIIAFGGRDVSEIKIIDALWPDTEGDKARQSFKFNLFELRKLLGGDRYLPLFGGRLTLNPCLCMVDVWQIERLLDEAELHPSLLTLKDALNLYKGDFLADDGNYLWTSLLREKIKNKIIKVAGIIWGYYADIGCHKDAIDVCLRLIEIDPLQEGFYQRLMNCYIKLGRTADAVITYRKCKSALMSGLGVGPSPMTEELYNKIRVKE